MEHGFWAGWGVFFFKPYGDTARLLVKFLAFISGSRNVCLNAAGFCIGQRCTRSDDLESLRCLHCRQNCILWSPRATSLLQSNRPRPQSTSETPNPQAPTKPNRRLKESKGPSPKDSVLGNDHGMKVAREPYNPQYRPRTPGRHLPVEPHLRAGPLGGLSGKQEEACSVGFGLKVKIGA